MSEKKMFLLEDFCKVKQPFLKFQSVREFLERDEKWVSIFRNSFKESFVFLNALLTSDQEEAHKLIDGGIH